MDKGITKLSVGGFKSIGEETTLDIKPLTLLGGANSSGKSSFMQPLLLLKQTLEAPYDPGLLPLVLDEGHVKFTSIDQFFTRNSSQNFSAGVYSSTDWFKAVFGKTEEEKRLVLESNEFSDETTVGNVVVRASMTKEEMLEEVQKARKNSNRPTYSTLYSVDTSTVCIERNRFFLDICSRPQDDTGCVLLSAYTSWLPFSSWILVNILYTIHVPGWRENERTYSPRGTGPKFPGTFTGHYAASIIANWKNTKNEEKLSRLEHHLKTLGLTSKIIAQQRSAVEIEVMVGRLLNDQDEADMVSIADVGVGVSQTLPVLVALLAAEPGQLVYLEQPEIHLHPRAQRALASVLVEAANRGVKVVAETHSSMLLLAVQTLIAKGEIDHNDVAMHWFERDKDGMSKVATAELDEAGRFGKWPVDFGKEELGAGGEYLDAVVKRKSVK